MKHAARTSRLKSLRQLGFDETKRSGQGYRVRCSQCQAMVINGVPTHERGCPNAPRKSRHEDYARHVKSRVRIAPEHSYARCLKRQTKMGRPFERAMRHCELLAPAYPTLDSVRRIIPFVSKQTPQYGTPQTRPGFCMYCDRPTGKKRYKVCERCADIIEGRRMGDVGEIAVAVRRDRDHAGHHKGPRHWTPLIASEGLPPAVMEQCIQQKRLKRKMKWVDAWLECSGEVAKYMRPRAYRAKTKRGMPTKREIMSLLKGNKELIGPFTVPTNGKSRHARPLSEFSPSELDKRVSQRRRMFKKATKPSPMPPYRLTKCVSKKLLLGTQQALAVRECDEQWTKMRKIGRKIRSETPSGVVAGYFARAVGGLLRAVAHSHSRAKKNRAEMIGFRSLGTYEAQVYDRLIRLHVPSAQASKLVSANFSTISAAFQRGDDPKEVAQQIALRAAGRVQPWRDVRAYAQ